MAPVHKARAGPSTPVPAAPAPRDLTPKQVSIQKAGTKAGKAITKTVTAFQPPNSVPVIYDRVLTEIKGERHARRPSSLAKAAKKRLFTEVSPADGIQEPDDGWSDEEEAWPLEDREEDCGWAAGPIERELPPFKGKTPGPADTSLDKDSTPVELLATQIPLEFKEKWLRYTKAHAVKWRADRPDSWRKDQVECSMRQFWRHLKPATFDIWLAAKILVSQLKPEVPASVLWDRNDRLFDAQLFSVLTYKQYVWLNRHGSFADYGNDANQLNRGEEGFDMHRKRRELVDDLCKAFGAAWNPHQHLVLDEATRDHKHQGKQRIRFKAAVHSGNLVDELNDTVTKYCVWFEEQHWLKKRDGEDDPNTVKARLLRATEVLHDQGARRPASNPAQPAPMRHAQHPAGSHPAGSRAAGKDSSTANFCVSLDRGYGNVEGQAALRAKGVFSEAMVQKDRVGLPRKLIERICKELGKCTAGEDEDGGAGGGGKRQKCSHGPDVASCMKYCWTVVHKGEYELRIWQDAQPILSYGNFFSTSRCGEVNRGAHGAKESYAVWAPESIWHYNLQGRSGTDGHDQQRKKLAMASGRRVVRAGVKGILFALDLALTNGWTMWQFLGEKGGISRTKLDHERTKARRNPARVRADVRTAFRATPPPPPPPPPPRVRALSASPSARAKVAFSRQWADSVLRAAKPLRRRKPASLCVMETGATNSADMLSPASTFLQQLAEHELVDMGVVARKAKAAKRGARGPEKKRRVQTCRGACGYTGCPRTGLPKRTQLRCGACNKGRGVYYHMGCFFKVHRCHRE